MRLDRRLCPRLSDPDFLILTLLRDALAPHAMQSEGIVVDYGCGTKPYRSLFRRAARYVGVDFGVSGPDDLAPRSDGGLPLDDLSADVVLSTQVLEHAPDVAFYLSECWRVLRPGGKLLLSTHGTWPYHGDAQTDDYWRWTFAGLQRTAKQAGFEILEIETVCGGWRIAPDWKWWPCRTHGRWARKLLCCEKGRILDVVPSVDCPSQFLISDQPGLLVSGWRGFLLWGSSASS